MANINIETLDLNGNDLFQDSESFITELDDNGESIVGGWYKKFYNECGFTGFCGNTIGKCGNTIGKCGKTAFV